MNSARFIKGFTLLELLIALSIFAIMATMAYGGLRLVLAGNEQLEQAAANLSSLHRTFLFLQQDIQQAVPRGVRDELGSLEGAFVCCTDEKLLHLTIGGVSSVVSEMSSLKRVEYSLTDGRLVRKVWSTLDRVEDGKSSKLQLVEGVQDVVIKILSYDDSEWQTSLPPVPMPGDVTLPRAVEVTITTEHYGAVSRMFVIGS